MNWLHRLENEDLSPKEQMEQTKQLFYQFLRLHTSVEKFNLFSFSNEFLEDISTNDLKFLLVIYFYGYLFTKLSFSNDSDNTVDEEKKRKENAERRLKNLTQAIQQFKSFLQRISQLEAIESQIDQNRLEQLSNLSFDLQLYVQHKNSNPMKMREEKVMNHKRKIAVEKKIAEIEPSIQKYISKLLASQNNVQEDEDNTILDEEILREYWTQKIQLHVMEAFEQLEFISQEMKMLQMVINMKPSSMQPQKPTPSGPSQQPKMVVTNVDNLAQQGHIRLGQNGAPSIIKLVPNNGDVLLRQQIYNQVFVDRNAPTKSLEEFAEEEMERMREKQQQEEQAKKEMEKNKKKEDSDEAVDEQTYKDREWDDWKDAHVKGAGNMLRH